VADAYGIPAQLLAKILQLLTKNGCCVRTPA
jgi:DNA-binding IscR family transcriptional regulator